MKKFAYILLFFVCSTSVGLENQDILEKIDQNRAPANTFTFHVKVSSFKDKTSSITELKVRVKDAKKSLVLYTAPIANKGRVLLMVEDNLWIYIPGTRNPIRISPQQQLMGQVSNADVARVVYSLDYHVDSLSKEQLDKNDTLKLTLVAKTKGAAYKSITLWVTADLLTPIKAEFYAISGRHLKTAYYKNYKFILGKMRPMLLEIHDQVQKDSVTILEYTNYSLESTPDIYFQKSYMERFSSSQ